MFIKRILSLMLVVLVFAVSCKKTDDEVITTPTPDPIVEEEVDQVEEDKGKIEDAGVEIVSEITALKNDESIKTTVSFSSFLDQSDPFGSKKKSPASNGFFNVISQLNNFALGNVKLYDIFTTMNDPGKSKGDDPESIQEVYDEIKGEYTWNFDSLKWDYKLVGTSIVFKFPSTEDGITNDAELTVSYTGHQLTDTTLIDGYSGDVPSLINADITIGTTTVIDYNFTASYGSDDIPTAISTSLALGTFVFAIDIINTTSAVSVNKSLKHGTKTLIDIGAGSNGNFDYDNIEQHLNDDTEIGDIDEVVTSLDAHFQVLTIKIEGDLDVDNLVDDVEIYQNDSTTSEDDILDDVVNKVNNRLDLAVYYTTDNSKIADIEAYTYTYTDEYGDEYLEIDFRFVFADGSKIDAETYFDDGFSDVIDALNDFIDDLNTEYELDLENI